MATKKATKKATTSDTLTLTPDALQALVAQAVQAALGAAPTAPASKPAKVAPASAVQTATALLDAIRSAAQHGSAADLIAAWKAAEMVQHPTKTRTTADGKVQPLPLLVGGQIKKSAIYGWTTKRILSESPKNI